MQFVALLVSSGVRLAHQGQVYAQVALAGLVSNPLAAHFASMLFADTIGTAHLHQLLAGCMLL